MSHHNFKFVVEKNAVPKRAVNISKIQESYKKMLEVKSVIYSNIPKEEKVKQIKNLGFEFYTPNLPDITTK